jgi:hypothetical protein
VRWVNRLETVMEVYVRKRSATKIAGPIATPPR